MSGNFSAAEIVALIAEVGEGVELCLPSAVQAAQPAYGIGEQTTLQCRTVSGYVTSQRHEVALAQSAPAVSGVLLLYLAAGEATREELNNPQVRIRYQGKDYQFEYMKGHWDRGALRLHQLRLID